MKSTATYLLIKFGGFQLYQHFFQLKIFVIKNN